MDTWILVTLLAAFAQTVRFGLQKQLKETALSTGGATFARFVYSAPLAVLGMLTYASLSAQPLPHPTPVFWAYALGGGLAQVLATLCVVALFARRNFSVGVAFSKTAVLMSVLVGAVVLGDRVSLWGFVAILGGLAGVLLLSDPPQYSTAPWRKRILNGATALGLASGLLFAFSGVGYRGASLSLQSGDAFLRAVVTLASVTTAQSLGMALWLGTQQKGEIGRVFAAWRVAGLVGITSLIGSACWFTAFTLQNVAYVNAVGQVELLFSLGVTLFWFRETITVREWQGGAILMGSILLLILLG